MNLKILYYLASIFVLIFATMITILIYFFLSSITFLPRKTKRFFFEKTIIETLQAKGRLKRNFVEAVMENIIDKLSGYFDVSKLDKKIERAGIKEYRSLYNVLLYGLMYSGLLFVTLLVARLVIDMPILMLFNVITIPIGFYIPISQIESEVKKKDNQVRIEAPEVLDLIRQGVGAGLIFIEAIKEARPQNGGALDYLLKDVIAEIEITGDHNRAIKTMVDKINDEKIRDFLKQLTIAIDAGKERQIEICSSLAKNIRELDEVAKDIRISSLRGTLEMQQYTCVMTASLVLLVFVLFDAVTKF